jgi:hypothetical protein
MTNTDTPQGARGDVRPQSRNTKAPTTGIVKAFEGTGTGTHRQSTPAATKPPPGARARARARFAHKVDRRWWASPDRRPLPKHWRLVCDLALAMSPRHAHDPIFHRAVAAALSFATPRRDERTRDVREVDAWARDPWNLASLAVDLMTMLRARPWDRGAR